MKKELLSICLFLLVLTYQAFSQDIVSGGSNTWILHTPDDGRTSMFVAPLIDNGWAWQYSTLFLNNGGVIFSGNITTQGNVGIGATVPLTKLQIGSSYPNLLNLEESKVGSNFFNSGGYKRIIGSYASMMDFADGSIKFNLANWGNTNDAITWNEAMRIDIGGNVGIGTSSPTYKLDVVGTIRAREIKVDLNGADFVFEKDYKLMPLNELELFIKEQKHLPEVAPAKEMQENGTDLGNLNSKLLQKMEEMTLYLIEQNKMILALKEKIEKLETASK